MSNLEFSSSNLRGRPWRDLILALPLLASLPTFPLLHMLACGYVSTVGQEALATPATFSVPDLFLKGERAVELTAPGFLSLLDEHVSGLVLERCRWAATASLDDQEALFICGTEPERGPPDLADPFLA